MKNSTPIANVPLPIEGPGMLYLRFFERVEAMNRVANALDGAAMSFECENDVLLVAVPEADISELLRLLSQTLFIGEQNVVKAIWEAQGQAFSLRGCFDVETLRSFLSRAQSGWFLDLLREKRFETHFQPIISVDRPEQVFAFEALLRGKVNDATIAPDTLFDVARGLNLGRQLDDAARLCAIESAARHHMKSKIFLNISPNTLGDGRDTLRSTLEAVERVGLVREQIVFEIVESECIEDVPQLKSALAGLRKSGFRVALDDLGAGYASLQLLAQLRPDYVKLDKELVLGVDTDPFKALIAQKLLETARALGVVTVAEGVESRAQWEWLRAHGGDFAQGFYFARPSSPPPVMSSRGMFSVCHAAMAF
jgi:EAL domain-containing protein (putative c-di-GMP-specific phosphodiesterase class I)